MKIQQTIFPAPAKKKIDYFFSYSNRYRSGSFDLRKVSRWKSTGEAYYLQYHIFLEDGAEIVLEPTEFYEFQTKFNLLDET